MSHGKLIVDAVVFDLDGTLIDSIPVHFEVLNTAFERLGLPPVSWEHAMEAAKEGRFDWDLVLSDDNRARKDEIMARCIETIAEIQSEMLRKKVRLIEGTVEILHAISEAGMKIALVTSTQRRYISDKLHPFHEAGIAHLFEVIITTDDVPVKKPAPAPLIECGRRLDLSPERMVYVGDSHVDIRAGKAAGMRTIGVLTGMDDYGALAAEGPDAILESILDLREKIQFTHQEIPLGRKHI